MARAGSRIETGNRIGRTIRIGAKDRHGRCPVSAPTWPRNRTSTIRPWRVPVTGLAVCRGGSSRTSSGKQARLRIVVVDDGRDARRARRIDLAARAEAPDETRRLSSPAARRARSWWPFTRVSGSGIRLRRCGCSSPSPIRVSTAAPRRNGRDRLTQGPLSSGGRRVSSIAGRYGRVRQRLKRSDPPGRRPRLRCSATARPPGDRSSRIPFHPALHLGGRSRRPRSLHPPARKTGPPRPPAGR